MAENFYTPFTTGGFAHDLRIGDGAVEAIIETDLYPVKVLFQDGQREAYTAEGLAYIEDKTPLLYPYRVQITPIK